MKISSPGLLDYSVFGRASREKIESDSPKLSCFKVNVVEDAKPFIDRRKEIEQIVEKFDKNMLEGYYRAAQDHHKTNKWLTESALLGFEGEVSLQAARDLNIPGNQPFWLMYNWERYEAGQPLVIRNSQQVHPQSDEIRAWLDQHKDQISVIRDYHERLDSWPDFDSWAKDKRLSFETEESAQLALEYMDQIMARLSLESDNALDRASAAASAYGGIYA